jgi:hypothetical protein
MFDSLANYVFGRHPFVFILAMIVAGAVGGGMGI